MDKATYLKNKELLKKQIPTYQRENYCYRCNKMPKLCLCNSIEPFDPYFEFVILIHPMEARKEKMGTGKISHAFLEKSQIIMGIDFTNDKNINEMIENNKCFIMYPGESAINVSTDDLSLLQNLKNNNEKIIIFLIDGTWPCAKKMMKLSTNLHSLPRVSFNVLKESMFAIKEQPSKFCLSTIESIHLFLSECERRGLIDLNKVQDKMLSVFQSMIDFQVKCASDPELNTYRRKTVGYSKPTDRTPSKKWETRTILFKGK